MKINSRTINILLFAISLSFIAFITTRYVGNEHNIYYWDSNGYWRFWQQFGSGLFSAPVSTMSTLLSSIKNDDYNLLPVAITSVFYIVGGESRLVYILSLSIVYLFPVTLLFYILINQFSEEKSVWWKGILLVLPATFVAFWAPTLRGYPDICGLVFILFAVIYSSKADLSGKLDLKKAIILGLLLWAPFLLRRWYAYTIVSLYISLPLLNYYLYKTNGHSLKRIFKIAVFFFVSGMSSVLLSVILQWNLLKRIASTDYSFIYSAYQSSVELSINNVIHDIGLYLLPMFLLSICLSFFTRKTQKDYLVIFSAFNLIFSFFIFTRTQSPGVHHCLPFALWALIVSTFGLQYIFSKLSNNASKITFIGFITIVCLVVNQQSLFDKNDNFITNLLPIKYLPMRVDNYNNYLRLSSDIQGMLHGDDKLTVLSSSSVLNDNMLDTLSNQKLSNFIAGISQVDLRDGLNVPSLMSKYFIVADPVQTHLNPSGQQVITIPADQLLRNEGIGKAFKRIGQGYPLERGVTAYIYERMRPYTYDEMMSFISKYYVSYPQWKGIYDTDLFIPYATGLISLGDIWGKLSIDDDGTIYAHPGETRPTTINWTLNGVKAFDISSIKNTCQAADGVDVTISDLSGHEVSTHVENNHSATIDLSKFNNVPISMSIGKHGNPSCDSIRIVGKK
ncbi:hypothetical protein J1782_11860 [Rahnella sp. BCC 1045]|nr:hypothetical protein [Rahnella sp. BCC 1045]MBU9820592.1 hypothetical protein [Rahnella sp. BCC 1045]